MNPDHLGGKINYLIKDKEFPSVEERKQGEKIRAADKFLTEDCHRYECSTSVSI